MSLRTPSIVFALTLASVTARADTSATLSTAINLPRGPASIEGFGQGYDLSPASGLPSLRYPLEVPPGRAGLQPELALHYHAGEGAGLLGLGWSLGLPAIERSLRTGIPRYDDTDAWLLHGLGGGEELVEVAPGVFRERIEQGPPLIVNQLPDGTMTARATDGTGYLFGLTPDARLESDLGIFRLELSAITDVHGNRLDFHYTREPGTDGPRLAAITYNDGHAAVRFDYEERPDLVRTRAPGFSVELRHRLRSITTEVDGAALRTTTLRYQCSVFTPASALVQIDTVAADGTALPAWHLAYTGPTDEPRVFTLADAPALYPTADGRAWVDLDGDALPDLLDTTAGTWRFRKNLATALATSWTTIPTPAATVSTSSRFADLTGDGIADLLAQPTEGELWAFTGGAVPFGESTSIAVDLDFDLTVANVALVDLNLDGRVDVLRHDDADAWFWQRHFDAPGYLPAEPVPPSPAGMRLGDPGVQLADLDGDRLPDLVRLLPTERRILVAVGEGFGVFADPVDLRGIPDMVENQRWELADINGDGAADLVRIGDTLDLHIYQHDGGFAQAASIPWPALEADEIVILSDVDASGTVDVLRVDTDGSQPWRVWSFAMRPGLLARLRTGLGYTRDFTYRPAAALALDDAANSPWTSTPPTALPVLVLSEETDAHTPWRRITEHHVRDGWYDPVRGDLRGFAELREHAPGDDFTETATITRRYDLGQHDETRKLQLLAEETASPRGVLIREAHTLEVTTPAPGVRVVHRAATDTFHLEAGPESAVAHVRTEWDHDEWANLTEERALGRVDLTGDERTTTNLYAEPRADDGPRDRLAEQIVTDGAGNQITRARTYYDGVPEQGLPLGEVDARGAVARVETWLADDTWIPTLRQTLDARGNVIRLRDAEDGLMTRHYDDLGLFPLEEHLHLDNGSTLTTTATWDARHGHPREVTAPNGATTRAEYDGLGRLTAEIEPGDTPALPTTRYKYYLDGITKPPSVVTELRRVSGEHAVDRAATHLDGLGRLVADITQDDDGTGAILRQARRYSTSGAIAEVIEGQRLPPSALAPGATIPLVADWSRTRSHTDALGRVIFSRDADGYETATTYLPLTVERRDHEDLHPEAPYTSTPERTEIDGLGRTLARVQSLADRNILHNYEHDAAGRLVAYTDPAGHRTTFTRDGAGRLTTVVSPDAGEIHQRHDSTGRLLERVTATGARITWAYDSIGRLEHEHAYDSTGTQTGDIRYHYDEGAPGQLAAVEDDAGRVDFTYDTRGRIVHMTRRFTTARGSVSLSSGQVYDAQDHVVRDVFPDGSTLEHDYSARGLERPSHPFVQDVEYDALARWSSLTVASGVELSRQLDGGGRVHHQSVQHGPQTILDLAHRYDVAGQLAETHDDLGAENFSLAQTYVYDDLRRLIGSTAGGRVSTWRYGDDGNLVEQAGHALAYDDDRPHAAVTLDAQNLAYDAAGQLAEVTGDGSLPTGTWRHDPHGRVESFIAGDGRRVEHVYSYTGERAIRREYDARGELEHETLYFTRNAEVRDGQLVRWIYFAGERIAESSVSMPSGGFADLPAETLSALHPRRTLLPAWLLAVLAALALLLRQLARPLVPARMRAPALVLVSTVGVLSCRHHEIERILVPDENTRYHLADRLGSAALVLDHRGRLLARDASEPYGQPRLTWRDSDADGPIYRFTGKEDDPLSGAIAIGARHYLPALGRWASPDLHFLLEDPIAALTTPGEANPYSYVGGNPIGFTDPTGRKGVAHGREHRPGVLDNYPDSPNSGFDSRMAAVEQQRALAKQRAATLTRDVLGVLDFAMTAVDWVLTASDAYDTATLAAGLAGAGYKLGKHGIKLALKRARKAVKESAAEAVKAARDAAHNAANFTKLKKDLASRQQLGELKDAAEIMAGKGGRVPIRDVDRLVKQYGGTAEDWTKIRSSNYKAPDGTSFETHAYRNEASGQVVEPKTKFQ